MQNRLTSRMITNLRDKPTIGLSGFFGIAASLALCRVMIPVSVDISDKDAAAMLSGQKTVTTVNDIKMKPITTKILPAARITPPTSARRISPMTFTAQIHG